MKRYYKVLCHCMIEPCESYYPCIYKAGLKSLRNKGISVKCAEVKAF
ncbi:hypothetical protein J41TS4_44520 [Paenibacillus apis]|uniref:Uncharacterized protein n=1 Tax=Paenibacillus apis TaxID=1792174 RepID=A0A920CPB2_9BACL|nr:hypothetical protein J41TS4_44520 [Paenibacillus apis]